MTRPSPINPPSTLGFSLLELLVVVVLVSILTTIALPSYLNYLKTSRRTDAISSLTQLEAAEETYRFNNTSYGTLAQLASLSQLTLNGDNTAAASPLGYYTLSISSVSSTGYTLTATAVTGGVQANDTTCQTMTLNLNSGVETKSPTVCWGS